MFPLATTTDSETTTATTTETDSETTTATTTDTETTTGKLVYPYGNLPAVLALLAVEKTDLVSFHSY